MKIAYDAALKKPGCVLLQAVMGGTVPPSKFHECFDAADWLLAPTPDLRVYEVTEEQLRKLTEITKRQRRETSP